MGHHSSTGRRTNRRSKAFFTTALIAALLLIFAPMAWPESATEAEAGPAVMRAAPLIPTPHSSPRSNKPSPCRACASRSPVGAAGGDGGGVG